MRKIIPAMVRCLAIIAAGLGLASCASEPPPPQQAVTSSTLADAERAGAVQYAPVELNRARDELAQSQRANERGDRRVALRFAEKAEADAKLAAVKAQAAHAAEAVSALNRADTTIRTVAAPPAAPPPTGAAPP